jgi:peptidoglycan hydrolase CwlO-like protein
MKKVIVVLAIVFLSSMAALAQENSGGNSAGQGMMGSGDNSAGPGMMGGGGYGTGSEMMGGEGNGKNTGTMGQGYSQRPECQEFYNETTKLRKELHEKRFEYFETQRNPKASMETITKYETQIKELQEKISAKAPPGCR